MSDNNVRFVRINGRIVPIRSKNGKQKNKHGMTGLGAGASALAGGHVGGSIGRARAGRLAAEKFGPTLMDRWNLDQVDVKDFVQRSGVKNMDVVRGYDEAQGKPLPQSLKTRTFWQRMQFNAAFAPDTRATKKGSRGGYVFSATNSLNRSIVAHELGHAREWQQKPLRYLLDRSVLTGGQYRREVAAWDLAPAKNIDPEIKKAALGTYKYAKRGTRAGFAIGAAAALAAYAAIKVGGSNGK